MCKKITIKRFATKSWTSSKILKSIENDIPNYGHLDSENEDVEITIIVKKIIN